MSKQIDVFKVVDLEFKNALQNTPELQKYFSELQLVWGIYQDENSMIHSVLQSVDSEYNNLYLQKNQIENELLKEIRKITQITYSEFISLREKEILKRFPYLNEMSVRLLRTIYQLLSDYASEFRKIFFQDIDLNHYIELNQPHRLQGTSVTSPIDSPRQDIANNAYHFSKMDTIYLPALALFWKCNILVLQDNPVTHHLELLKQNTIHYHTNLPTTLLYYSDEHHVIFRVGEKGLEHYQMGQFPQNSRVLDDFVEMDVRQRVKDYQEGNVVYGIGNFFSPSFQTFEDHKAYGNVRNVCNPTLSLQKEEIKIEGMSFFRYSCVDSQKGIMATLFDRKRVERFGEEDQNDRGQKHGEIQKWSESFGKEAMTIISGLQGSSSPKSKYLQPKPSQKHQRQSQKPLPPKINLINNQMSVAPRRKSSSERRRRQNKGQQIIIINPNNNYVEFATRDGVMTQSNDVDMMFPFEQNNNKVLTWNEILSVCSPSEEDPTVCSFETENNKLFILDKKKNPFVFKHTGKLTFVVYNEMNDMLVFNNQGDLILSEFQLKIYNDNNKRYLVQDSEGKLYNINEVIDYYYETHGKSNVNDILNHIDNISEKNDMDEERQRLHQEFQKERQQMSSQLQKEWDELAERQIKLEALQRQIDMAKQAIQNDSRDLQLQKQQMNNLQNVAKSNLDDDKVRQVQQMLVEQQNRLELDKQRQLEKERLADKQQDIFNKLIEKAKIDAAREVMEKLEQKQREDNSRRRRSEERKNLEKANQLRYQHEAEAQYLEKQKQKEETERARRLEMEGLQYKFQEDYERKQREKDEQARVEQLRLKDREREVEERLRKEEQKRQEDARLRQIEQEEAVRKVEERLRQEKQKEEEQAKMEKLKQEQLVREIEDRMKEQKLQLEELEKKRKLEREAERQKVLEEERERIRQEKEREEEYERKIQKRMEEAEKQRKALELRQQEEKAALELKVRKEAEEIVRKQKEKDRQIAEERERLEQRENEKRRQFMEEIEKEKRLLRTQAEQDRQRLNEIRKSRKLASKYMAKDKSKKSLFKRVTKKLFGSSSRSVRSSSDSFRRTSSDGMVTIRPLKSNRLQSIANIKSRR